MPITLTDRHRTERACADRDLAQRGQVECDLAPGRLQIRPGHSLLLDDHLYPRQGWLRLASGMVRVVISDPRQEALDASALTLGFLQQGDHLSLELLRHSRLHLQALSHTELVLDGAIDAALGGSSLQEWTVALLMIRNQSTARQRIIALLRLLVQQLGQRHSDWYALPLRFTHAELAELCGLTRVTVSRQLSEWRKNGLIDPGCGAAPTLRVAPQLLEV